MSKVKIAMIGAGNIANAHLEAYKSVPDAEIYAACDINEERLNETCDNLGKRDYLKTSVGWMPRDAKPDDPCTVEDFATAIIRYDNGAVTQLETAYSINGEDMGKKQIFGTKAGLDLSDGVKLYSVYNDFLADINVNTQNYKDSADMFVSEMSHFVDCIVNGTECRAKARDGIEVMRILDAIYESAKTGHEVIL